MTSNENENYPFTISVPKSLPNEQYAKLLNHSDYKIGKHDNNKVLGFDKFDHSQIKIDDVSGDLYLGLIRFPGNTEKELIDAIKNKDAITSLNEFYNAQKEPKVYANSYEEQSKNENLFDFLDFLKIETARMSSDKAKSFYSNIALMYDQSYCSMAYRAAENISDVSVIGGILAYEGGSPAKLPVFSLQSDGATDPKARVVVRDFKFEMRRINTSTGHYVFEYPEYLFSAGKYRNTDIDYIEAIGFGSNPSIWYSYADESQNLFYNADSSTKTNVSEELQAL